MATAKRWLIAIGYSAAGSVRFCVKWGERFCSRPARQEQLLARLYSQQTASKSNLNIFFVVFHKVCAKRKATEPKKNIIVDARMHATASRTAWYSQFRSYEL